jgi:uncharacterized damage-inducible protein DinB
MTLQILQDYVEYNLWANQTIVNWLKTKPLDLMTQETPSSFPTIRETLLHIWSAETIWLERLRGEQSGIFLQFTFKGDSEAVFEGLLQGSANFAQFVQSLTAEQLLETLPFRLLNGQEDTRNRYQMIHHCMNHSAYHRGQMVTMARCIGLTDPPSTDQIRFFRER